MNSRYHTDENGQVRFAVCVSGGAEARRVLRETDEDTLWIKPVLHASQDKHVEAYFVPIDQVQITDELACSRAELGPVWVVHLLHGEPFGIPFRLACVNEHGAARGMLASEGAPARQCRIATPEELAAAGIEA